MDARDGVYAASCGGGGGSRRRGSWCHFTAHVTNKNLREGRKQYVGRFVIERGNENEGQWATRMHTVSSMIRSAG